jgi:hypothetical protein
MVQFESKRVQLKSKKVHFKSKNVHFRPLFAEGLHEALSLDTVGKDCDQARISKEEPIRHIVSICFVFTP